MNGRETEVRLELKDLYSGLEEAKADVMGIYNEHFMIEKGLLPAGMKEKIAVTYLAGLFRSIRFGIGEAHGKGNALEFNYLIEKGALAYDESDGRFSVNFEKFDSGIRELVRDICLLQANGDYDGTKKLFEDFVHLPTELKAALQKLDGIPVDIAPRYPLAENSGWASN